MKIIFLVLTSKTHNHNDFLNIDRVDLTRKLDIINTWGNTVIEEGHELIFFEGGDDNEYYDNDTRTLHLNLSDSYETNDQISPLFYKVKSATKWVYNNIKFDYVYICDDDVYVNLKQFLKNDLNYDFISHGSLGGGGFFYSRKGIEKLINDDTITYGNCDSIIYNIMSNDDNIKKSNNNSFYPFYMPCELYSTIHYVTGKRMYFVHNLINFYNENGFTNSKILLNVGVDSTKENNIVSYESTIKRKTKRWYDWTVDKNNWQYHGNYIRSLITMNNLLNYWPYGYKSIKYLVINIESLLNDYKDTENYFIYFDYLIKKSEESLIDKNNLFLCSNDLLNFDGWILDNNIKNEYKLNFENLNNLNYFRKKI